MTQSSLRTLTIKVLKDIDLLPEDKYLQDKYIKLVTSIFEKSKYPEINTKMISSPDGMALLKKAALLKLGFCLTNLDIQQIIAAKIEKNEVLEILKTRKKEHSILANSYAKTKIHWEALIKEFESGNSFDDIDLLKMYETNPQMENSEETPQQAILLRLAKVIEEARLSDDFQENNPDAICIVAEHYIAMGEVDLADTLLEQILEDSPNHIGAHFQKARLLLKKSVMARRQARHYNLLMEVSDPLSAAERNYQELSDDEMGTADSLNQKAFEAYLKAYSLLPQKEEYEKQSIDWSVDMGTARNLRLGIIKFIVRETGRRCDLRRYDWKLRDKVEAGWANQEKTDSTPLFSEVADDVLVLAYRELIADYSIYEDRLDIMLYGLNFLKLLLQPDEYRKEVEAFVDTMKSTTALITEKFFRNFSPYSSHVSCDVVLHKHLDAVLSRSEQRDMVRIIYAKRVELINENRDQSLRAIYNDEISNLHDEGNYAGAYRAAYQGELEGIYKRDVDKDALVLLRSAQHAKHKVKDIESVFPSIDDHLNDKEMAELAERYFEEQFCDNHPDTGSPPSYLSKIYEE